jgi:hypothetical protein
MAAYQPVVRYTAEKGTDKHEEEMACIWQNGKDGDIGVIFQKIVNSCNNIDRQAKIQRMRENETFRHRMGDEERVGKRITYILLQDE